MNSAEFVERFLLDEVKSMYRAGVQLQVLAAIVHGIETAGALLDDKPFKAKGQGKKRFNRSLNKLFPKSYQETSLQFDLYNLLRSHIAHCMLPATQVEVHSNSADHLRSKDGVVTISLESLYQDHCNAMEKLISLIRSEHLKNKKIVFDNLNLK